MRLDSYLANKKYFDSRSKAQDAIKLGVVKLNGKFPKSSDNVTDEDKIEIINAERLFISNGGKKLEKALSEFNVSVENKTFIDVGASTGGFTDCLLRRGVKSVIALDVGESLLHPSIASDKRVKVIDNFNAKNLCKETVGELLDGAVIDVSFISLTYILSGVKSVLKEGGDIFALIKPQFECGPRAINKNGIVKYHGDRFTAIKNINLYSKKIGLSAINLTNAPIVDGKNIEYIIWLKNCEGIGKITDDLIRKCVIVKE